MRTASESRARSRSTPAQTTRAARRVAGTHRFRPTACARTAPRPTACWSGPARPRSSRSAARPSTSPRAPSRRTRRSPSARCWMRRSRPSTAMMDNVTPEHRGFRFGPHGLTFKKPVRITLPVRPDLLPSGMAGDRRVRILLTTRATVAGATSLGSRRREEGKVASTTTHFTDFINATLPMPDHPTETSFNPNLMKDIKLGDPARASISSSRPARCSSGSANLSYPLDVPPGRQGVQPTLQVTYNSEGANGWMGVGWDVGPLRDLGRHPLRRPPLRQRRRDLHAGRRHVDAGGDASRRQRRLLRPPRGGALRPHRAARRGPPATAGTSPTGTERTSFTASRRGHAWSATARATSSAGTWNAWSTRSATRCASHTRPTAAPRAQAAPASGGCSSTRSRLTTPRTRAAAFRICRRATT